LPEVKAAGYKIFVDTSLECGHLTTMIVNRKNKSFISVNEAKRTSTEFGEGYKSSII